MSHSSMTFTLQGSAEMERRLRALRDGAAERIVAPALRAAARPIVAAAKLNARVSKSGKRYGGLSKSIGSVVRNYRATQKILAVIGPQHGKVVMREGRREAPALIAHLVEFGHRIAVGGTLSRLGPRGLTRKKMIAKAGYHTWSTLVAAENKNSAWTDEMVWMPRIGGGGVWAYKHGYKGVDPKSKVTGERGGGRSKGFVEGQPFLRPAFDSQRAAAQQTLENKLREGIEREAAKG